MVLDEGVAMSGYGFAYFRWHWYEWVPTRGVTFSARDCRGCYDTFARLQKRGT